MNENEKQREINELDFSQFHPMDHYLWERRCREHFGGPVNHVKLWWAYKCEYKPSDLWHKVMCRTGRHHVTGGQTIMIFGRETTVTRCCCWCRKTPEEIDGRARRG